MIWSSWDPPCWRPGLGRKNRTRPLSLCTNVNSWLLPLVLLLTDAIEYLHSGYLSDSIILNSLAPCLLKSSPGEEYFCVARPHCTRSWVNSAQLSFLPKVQRLGSPVELPSVRSPEDVLAMLRELWPPCCLRRWQVTSRFLCKDL